MSKVLGALLLALAAGAMVVPAAEAQQADSVGADSVGAENITLVYEREVYTYDGGNRRDPFRPLSEQNGLGPRFESLSLRGIIYATGRGRSVALLGDGDGRVHRVRVGDVVGNSRVIEIGPLRVVLAVENFGTIRQEILELPTRGGTDR